MRETACLQNGWQFARLASSTLEPIRPESWENVSLPHVWNRENPKESGCALYETKLILNQDRNQKRFLAFDGVCGVARIFWNGHFVGEHRGSYSRFVLEVTDWADHGENTLQILCDNTRFTDVNPLTGDFTYWGGVSRPVWLISTEKAHFDLEGPGICLRKADADGNLQASSLATEGRTEWILKDDMGKTLLHTWGENLTEKLDDVRRWNGQQDPYLYTLTANLWDGEVLADTTSICVGFRTVTMDAKKGFFLNGSRLKLHGVARHHDHGDSLCAPTQSEIEEDFRLIREIGANAVRLSHYQHPQAVYDICDRLGLIAWAEIPMLSMPDNNPGIRENAKSQMRELITQSRHHPAICFWGVQNEIAMTCETKQTYAGVAELNDLVKSLDDTRITGSANLYSVKNKSPLNQITDSVGYNIYFGWYYGDLADYGKFVQKFHQDCPEVALAITEYGADCNIAYQTETPESQDYTEQFQCQMHEAAYGAFRADESLWGSFVWAMFDFHSAIRDTGGVVGQNLKGLVTIDRKIKKDAFYFYKACWSEEPFVHLCGSRFVNRCGETTSIRVYSNQSSVTLRINGTVWENKQGKEVFCFENIPLKGTMEITAECGAVSDSIRICQVSRPDKSYEYPHKNERSRARNWFEGEEVADPERFYSLEDSIGDLLANPETKAILERELPQVMANPRTAQGGGMKLTRILYWSKIDDEALIRRLNRALNQIAKGEE